MKKQEQLSIKNTKSLKGDHKIDIRPLTILIGENNTGKSAILDLMSSRNLYTSTHIKIYNIASVLNKVNKNKISHILKELNKFGKISGLFQNMKLATVSSFPSLTININGIETNVEKTSHSLKQILPILVNVAVNSNYSHLIRNPECNLHPRVCAEFISWIISLMNTSHKETFIIETHSDGIIDRTRIEIAKGNIKPEDVSLVYFERNNRSEVEVHNIKFDNLANMDNVPSGYRKFFSEETKRLLGF